MEEYTSLPLTDAENVVDTVHKYGYAIIEKVIDESDCSTSYDKMWDYFEHISSDWVVPLSRTNEKSWKQIYNLFPLHSMLIQHFNVGHAQFVWDLRQNEKIVDIFAKIWNCTREELLVSFDGMSLSLPPEKTNRGWFNNLWTHTDQSFTRNEHECIQSWITLRDVNDGDATLFVLENSNNFHKEFAETFGKTDKSDWYKLTEEEHKWYVAKGCTPRRVKCPKGSMVFWDSRTIHCGVEPIRGRMQENIRAVVYLCYLPRSMSSAKHIVKKQKAFDELRMTTHWATKIKLFPKTPRTYGKELPVIKKITKPDLSALGLKLAGF